MEKYHHRELLFIMASCDGWVGCIQECITVHKEEARTGVSRQLLKKFAAEKYKLEPTATNIAHLNHAIAHGAEKGIFLLPKGSLVCEWDLIRDTDIVSQDQVVALSCPLLEKQLAWTMKWAVIIVIMPNRSWSDTLLVRTQSLW